MTKTTELTLIQALVGIVAAIGTILIAGHTYRFIQLALFVPVDHPLGIVPRVVVGLVLLTALVLLVATTVLAFTSAIKEVHES